MAQGESMQMKYTVIVACIVTGALTTVILKAMFETTVVLTDGSVSTFSCSFFAGLLNFFAIALLMLLQTLFEHVTRLWESPTVDASEAFSSYDMVCYMIGSRNIVLSLFHVGSTFCAQTALVFVPATVHAALRQGNIPIVVAIRVYIFKNSCPKHQWIGVSMLTTGLVLMAATSHMSGFDHLQPGGVMHYGFGVLLLLVASVLLAVKYMTEEIFMQRDKIPPMVVIGAQGVMGTIGSAILLVFAHYMGYEDFWKTVDMLHASSQLQVLAVEFVALTFLYHLSMAYITKIFDGACKAMVRGTKPIAVWALQLMCFYVLGSRSLGMQHYGEPWAPPMSWVVLFAAIIVSGGLCLYLYPGNKPSPN